MKKTYFATSSTGTPLLGQNFVLKDRTNALPDVPMTELGSGHYEAEVPTGTAWNVYEDGSDTGVIVDALFADTREPAVSSGNVAHVYFGNKVFRAINIADVSGLGGQLANHSARLTEVENGVEALGGYIEDLQSPVRTFSFGGKTYSMDPISVMTLPGYREDGVMGVYVKANWIVTESNESNPYFSISVPGDGTWVDAFRIKQSVSTSPIGFNTGYVPVGLLHNLQSVFEAPYADESGSITDSLDFKFSVIAHNPFSESGYYQIGQSVIGKFQGSFMEDAGGAPRIIVHSVRGIGAQIPVPGIQTKIKIEVRLNTPGAPLTISCNGGVTGQIHGQLYPEVP